MKVYIAGPMTGHDDWNHPAFNAAAEHIRARGWTPLNPAEQDLTFASNHPGEGDMIRAHYFRKDLPMLAEADAIAVLPGWQDSIGASLEVTIARVLALPIYDAETWQEVSDDWG